MRIRKDVNKFPIEDDTLLWYAKAVGAMKALPDTNPSSWVYQGAIHGYSGTVPPDRADFWQKCQHASSFFLPWHRMYLLYFEQIVAAKVVELGGPRDWALPYWNYSEDRAYRVLPAAFRNAKLQDGSDNPLYVAERVEGANAGAQILADRDVNLEPCLKADPDMTKTGFFGSPLPNHLSGGDAHYAGALEKLPHNAIHNAVGGGGWMSDPNLAALDPIFWLHHANIDRLWEVWLKRDPTHHNPTDTSWLNTRFAFHNAAGAATSLQVNQVLKLGEGVLDYAYQETHDPLAAARTVLLTAAAAAAPVAMPQLPPELAGASIKPVVLSTKPLHVDVPTPVTPRAFLKAAAPASADALAPDAPSRKLVGHVTLHLEQITSASQAATYDLYLNVPAGHDHTNYEDRFVARVAMFGIAEASSPDAAHGGSGQNFAFDITELYHKLADKGEIDSSNLQVSFVPVLPGSKGDVTVGRIGLYFS